MTIISRCTSPNNAPIATINIHLKRWKYIKWMQRKKLLLDLIFLQNVCCLRLRVHCEELKEKGFLFVAIRIVKHVFIFFFISPFNCFCSLILSSYVFHMNLNEQDEINNYISCCYHFLYEQYMYNDLQILLTKKTHKKSRISDVTS